MGIQQGYRPLPVNKIQQTTAQNTQRAGEPKDEQLRISYGIVAEVNNFNNRVRVDLFDRKSNKVRVGSGVDGVNEQGSFISLIQPLTFIHQQFGMLRKGLIVRVFWRGKHAPGNEAVAEIISDVGESQFISGNKSARSNELATAPHELFTGGLSSI